MREPSVRTEQEHSATATPATGWVLYDGQCGICSHWVPFWAPMLRHIGLDVAALDAPWVAERTGLSPQLLLSDLRLVHADGHLTSGADVYRHVMRQLWWAWPLYLVSVATGGRQIFDWGYRTFAAHRRQISHTCRIAPRTRP
jgi:predicted DCC family thiol-disulfide oxidoreductase YuxK